MLLYEQLADELGVQVARGTLRAGDRLPSVRRLSEERGVSVATVLSAYAILEGRGLTESRPKSGYFVRGTRGPNAPVPSPPRRAPAAARIASAPDADDLILAMSRGSGHVPLGTASIAPELLPLRRLNTLLAAVAREGGGPGAAYEDLAGQRPLRRQLARCAVRWGVALDEDDFITTAGATEALNLALGVVAKAGDIIAVESPVYFGFLRLAEMHSLRVIEIPTDPQTGLDLDALDDAIRASPVRAVLATPNFQNPLGARMPDENKERLVKMLARREIPLIEDDVYGDLSFDGTRPRPVKAFDDRGNVLLCGTFSKTLAPGYRVGWIVPGRFQELVERRKFAQSVASASPTQMAIAELLGEGGYERHVRRLRRALASQSARYRDAIAEAFPSGTKISQPQGGYVLWVELASSVDAAAIQRQALDRGIAIAPGSIFSARRRFGHCLRISTGYPWSPRIERAIATVGDLVARVSP